MSRHFIKDDEGNDVRTSDGKRLFWSDRDGDGNPDERQTVYEKDDSLWGGSTKVESTFNPSTGRFNK